MTASHRSAPAASAEAALRRLAAALERENAALAALDLAAIGALLAEKEAALAALAAAPKPAPTLPAPTLPAPTLPAPTLPAPTLIEATRAVAALAARNRRLLEHALAVQGRVIALVARAARPAADGGYRAPGRRAPALCAAPRTLCARA